MLKVFRVVLGVVFISSVSCSRSLQQSPSPSPSARDYINAGLSAIQLDPNGTAAALANCMLATYLPRSFGLHLCTMCCLWSHRQGDVVE